MKLLEKTLIFLIAAKVRFVKGFAIFGALAVPLLLPLAARCEPIRLKLSFYAPSQTQTYQYGVKPFVDAVNAEGKGLLTIDVYPNSSLGGSMAEQPKLVLDGKADIAFVVPGQTPYRFPDNELLEQPGLFRNAREGTLAYTRSSRRMSCAAIGSFS